MTRNIFDDLEKNRDYTIERLDGITSAISLFTVSSEIKFLYFNKAADEMFGYGQGGLMEETSDEPLSILHPDNEDNFYSEIIATMRDGKHFSYNCRIRCADGSYKWAQISAEMVSQSGGVLHYYGVITLIPAPDNILLQGLHTLMIASSGSGLDILADLIESKGGSCSFSNYGMDGFDKFEYSEPGYYHCIFVGTHMQDVNGVELIKEIRFGEHPHAATIPVILLADNLETDPEVIEDMSITAVITKPFNTEHITQLLRRMVPESK